MHSFVTSNNCWLPGLVSLKLINTVAYCFNCLNITIAKYKTTASYLKNDFRTGPYFNDNSVNYFIFFCKPVIPLRFPKAAIPVPSPITIVTKMPVILIGTTGCVYQRVVCFIKISCQMGFSGFRRLLGLNTVNKCMRKIFCYYDCPDTR